MKKLIAALLLSANLFGSCATQDQADALGLLLGIGLGVAGALAARSARSPPAPTFTNCDSRQIGGAVHTTCY